MAAIRRADLARRHERIGVPERTGGAGRFWFPHRGGSASDVAAACSMAVPPGALPIPVLGLRTSSTSCTSCNIALLSTRCRRSRTRLRSSSAHWCGAAGLRELPASTTHQLPDRCSRSEPASRTNAAGVYTWSRCHVGSSRRSAPARRRRCPLGARDARDDPSLAAGQRLLAAQPTGKGLAA
eukprot:8038535-Alexandrium_andersonii.AAC.1